MKRMHFKKNKKNKSVNIIILLIILLTISIVYLFKIFNQKLLPQLLNYSQIETKKIVSSIINTTVIENISKNTYYDDLFKEAKTSDNNIKSIDFNSSKVNKLLSDTTKLIEQNMKLLESGEVDKLGLENKSINKKGIIYEIPSGVVFDNVILNNIMPKIPVKINLIGNIFCKLNTNIEDYGINNALIKVNINIEVEIKILLPFASKNVIITSDVPIIMKLVEGSVPNYYLDTNYR